MKNKKIKEWFHSWFDPSWNHFEDIFDDDIYYVESWGPEYKGIEQIKQWFSNWHKEAKLNCWDIKQIIHKDNISVVEWYFSCFDKEIHQFEGVSLIEWSDDEKIKILKEYTSTLPHYNLLNEVEP